MVLAKRFFLLFTFSFWAVCVNAQTSSNFPQGHWTLTFERSDGAVNLPVDISVTDGKISAVVLKGGLKINEAIYSDDRIVFKGDYGSDQIEIKARVEGFRLLGDWQTRDSKGKIFGEFEPTARRIKLFDEIWQTVGKEFYTPSLNGVDWRSIGARYRKETESMTNDGQFYVLINKMLEELKSSHVGFWTVSKKVSFAAQTKITKGSNTDRADEKVISWKKLNSKVGYLRISSFAEGKNFVEDVDKAFAEIGDLPGLIIDLRGNEGGTLSIAMRIADYIYDKPQLLGVLATRHGLDTYKVDSIIDLKFDELPTFSGYDVSEFLDVMHKNGTVALVSGGRAKKQYRGKIVILADANSASASEGFISSIKETKIATIIGRTTEGALLSSKDFQLSDGWTLRLPEADFCTAKGFRPEAVGITPDIEVKKVEGKDADIERALEFLLQNK